MYEALNLLGESYYVALPLVAAYLLYRRKKTFWALLLSIALALVIVTVMKMAILEPRPCVGAASPIGCDDPLQSFPSRHAAVLATALVFLLPEAPLFVAYLAYFILICFTRVYLGQHYLHDVIAGAAIGLAIGYCCLKSAPCLNGALRKLSGKR